MSYLKSALDLAAKGFHVFPLAPNTKDKPLIKDYANVSTTDPAQIKSWWTDPVMGLEKDNNIGISTTKFNGGASALVVVDVDDKKGNRGSDVLLQLELQGYEVPPSFTQTTASGGKHIVYVHDKPVKQGAHVLGKGLDIRSKGGYIVGAGSTIDGVAYTTDGDSHLAECPEWIVKTCGAPNEKQNVTANDEIDQYNIAVRIKHYLQKEAPVSLEGDGGDYTAFKVAAILKDKGADVDTAYGAMLDHWNPRCLPPWDPEELEVKVKNAYSYGTKAPAVDAPETEFDIVEMADDSGSYLDKINKEYAIMFGGAQVSILHETVDQKGRKLRNFISELAFKRKFSTTAVLQEKGRPLTEAEVWLNWKGRREYAGLCFTPEKEPQHGYYNLWGGFAVKPKPYEGASASAKAGLDSFLDHAKTNVCEGDAELFNWLMGYFAHLIQKPWEKPLTTLVFQGSKGVGKNALIDRVGKLLGSGHYLVAHDGRYLTSNFNGHLDSCLCLVLDEAFWSGDKKAEGTLKGITTSPEIMIERKGKEPYMVDNLVRLIIIGNEDWLVPASTDERRYAVFSVGEGRKQQGDFFHKMRVNMDQKGGSSVLLNYLQNFDLKTVDVNVAPKTDALMAQKMASLSTFESFWYECLTEGRVINSDFSGEWVDRIPVSRFIDAYARYLKGRNSKSWVPTASAIGKQLKACHSAVERLKVVGGKGTRGYQFLSLEVCRDEWQTKVGQDVDW